MLRDLARNSDGRQLLPLHVESVEVLEDVCQQLPVHLVPLQLSSQAVKPLAAFFRRTGRESSPCGECVHLAVQRIDRLLDLGLVVCGCGCSYTDLTPSPWQARLMFCPPPPPDPWSGDYRWSGGAPDGSDSGVG